MQFTEYVLRWVRLLLDVRESELKALFWSFAYFFCILSAYFILRPVRDQMGIAGGVRALPWLFTGTFIAMLCVVPVFGWLVKRFRRRDFIPYVYWFFVINILAFWVLLTFDVGTVFVARAFFIWASVFNLFVVSVFWSFMADLFHNEQGRRLFGFIAAGGTIGTIVGPLISVSLAVPIGPTNLLLISAALLATSVYCVRKLLRASPDAADGPTPPVEEGHLHGKPVQDHSIIGGGIFNGITEIVKSPYLIGICFFIAMFTTTSTFLYFQQASLVADAFDGPGERTRVFAIIDLSVSTLTILSQVFITGRFIKYFGISASVSFLPLVTLIGFTFFAFAPTITMLIIFQVIRRASNFAITRPGREVLFTVVSREQKYKSKNFIDTVVYRGGDAVSGWGFTGLSRGLGLDIGTIAVICIPLAGLWMGVAWMLGRHQDLLASQAGRKSV